MDRRNECLACKRPGVTVFFEARGVPVLANFLHSTRESAVACARGDIALGFCAACGCIGNLAFDPSKLVYEEGYENPLHYSEVFRAYARDLAASLVERFDLRGKRVVEIGCGDGDFLRMICDIGDNRGVGFDPSYPASLPTAHERFEIVREIFAEKQAGRGADFVCSRHTLEHVGDPIAFLRFLADSAGGAKEVPVYIEVPNASYTLKNCFLWDIIYEHPSYFTSHSLPNVVEMSGLSATRVYEGFGGQYLSVEALAYAAGRREREPSPPAADALAEVEEFAGKYQAYTASWKERLDGLTASGRGPVLWGAGSKGGTFLNLLEAGKIVECVVDINPKKQGRFVAGAGVEIVAPERLRTTRPDVVIVANPVYRAEVEGVLRALGLAPELIAL
jgi:SAM-dependent methyltransferase